MISELIGLGNVIFITVVSIGIITTLNFVKSIYEQLILPILTPIMPIVSDLLSKLLYYISNDLPILIDNVIKTIKEKVLGIKATYKRINNSIVETTQRVYVLDENNKLKCMNIKGQLNYESLPEEIKNNLHKEHDHYEYLMREALMKLNKRNVC